MVETQDKRKILVKVNFNTSLQFFKVNGTEEQV